jgi:hypothetical protein
MVPTTTTALVILAVAVLPGSVYTWAFERQAAAFGVTLADRVLRFVAVSLVFDLLYAWPAYGLYRLVFAGHGLRAAQFAVLWAGTVVGVTLPALAGSTVGGLYATRSTRNGWLWVRRRLPPEREATLLTRALGRDPAPRAWDRLFLERASVYLRVRLRDGPWVAGLFASGSYAGGFPNEPDLFLEQAWEIDADGVLGAGPLGYAVYIPGDGDLAHRGRAGRRGGRRWR